MIVPVLLLVLLLVVFFMTHSETNEVSESVEPNKALLEPVASDEKKVADKLEAYKKDKEATRQESKELEESQVKGSDFYFGMQGSDSKYSEKLKERIKRMQSDPYSEVMDEYKNGETSENGSGFSNKMRTQLGDIDDQETFDQIVKSAQKEERIRKELDESMKFRDAMRKTLMAEGLGNRDSSEQNISPEVKEYVEAEEVKPEPRFLVKDGKRQRRAQYVIPGKSNLVKAAIYGDQTIVSGTPVKMRLLESLLIGGVEIPANTLFSGTASVGANRLKITIENFRYGTYMSPVSFTIYDNDAIEGLNLPNNMKAESARKLEQGLLQGVQLPISSIGTVTSEVTSAITATTQVAKQLLNQSLSQVKVYLKTNYQIFLKEETREDKRKREAEEAELEQMFKQIEIQKNEPTKKNPLTSLIESL